MVFMTEKLLRKADIIWIKRALSGHYTIHLIEFNFLKIWNLCNVIAKKLTFLTNRKFISISWKVWTCLNFSTSWKWKWLNRIWHGRKIVVGKQKFELIWEISVNQISLQVIKMERKKARLSETERFIEL